jgi:uncharacterized protein (TIGR03067 family)
MLSAAISSRLDEEGIDMQARFSVRLAVVAMLLVAGAQFSVGAQGDPKKDLDRFQGKWLATSFNGEAPPAEIFLVVAGDKYQQIVSGEVTEEGTVKVDVSKKPVWFDLSILTGPDAGKSQPGLAVIEGDVLTLSLAAAGNATRPATMDQAELYIAFKKAK